MNYIGSKIKLLPFIEKSILSVIDSSSTTFCDLFAGTGSVGSHFKKKGFKVIANDIQYYAYVLNKQLIENHQELHFNGLIQDIQQLMECDVSDRKMVVCDYLTNLKGKRSFLYKNYSPNDKSDRMYFTNTNAMKGDAARTKIEEWYKTNKIDENEYYFLIASLIKSMDRRANVLSVYGAYLKYFKKRAQKDLIIEPHYHIINDQSHEVYNEDANALIRKVKTDVLYLDPPYNSRQYASNYHVLETIAKYDNPKLYGKTGLREYNDQKSLYCWKEHASQKLEDLVQNADTKYIFLSYSNEGIIPQEEIKRILEAKGEYGYFKTDHSRYKSDSKRQYSANSTIEYLHYCICE